MSRPKVKCKIHGELTCYTLGGCRCDLCRKANAEEHRRYRKKRGKAYLRRINLMHSYGITPEQYDYILKGQNGVCAACGGPEVGRNQYGPLPLAVDHNHDLQKGDKGFIRGLLCMKCNRALGMLKSSPTVIAKLLEYIIKHS